ncbi:MAG: UV damage endonuclease UvsE, partial [Algoriphagus sp.]|nr:UV damage endonuclease UvsE [Algoriphagus sp.]
MMNLGYACLNMSLSNRKKSERITTNRSMIRRTFDQKGVDYASELALQNCKDLYSILQWNEEHNIKFFRLSSEFFPWASEYDIESLKDYEKIMYWC